MKRKIKGLLIGMMAFTAINTMFAYADTGHSGLSGYSIASDSDCDYEADWEYKESTWNGPGLVLTTYKGTDINVVIPSEIDGKPVVELDSYLFKNKGIQSVKMPDSITELGVLVFWNCNQLKKVEFGDGLDYIGRDTFRDCPNLTEIILPQNLIGIGSYAFWGCSGLEHITLPDNLKTVSWGAFAECESLSQIELPEGLEEVALDAFSGTGIRKLYIPKNVNKIITSDYSPTNIMEYSIHADNPFYSDYNGMILSKDKTTFYAYPAGKLVDQKRPHIKLPECVTTIPSMFNLPKANIFLSENITEITDFGEEHVNNWFEYESIWTPNGSYVERMMKLNQEEYVVATEAEFDAIMESEFELRYDKNTGWTVYDYYGDSNVMDIPSQIGSIKINHIVKEIFQNETVGTIIIPETVTSVEHQTLGRDDTELVLIIDHNIHKIVNNSNVSLNITDDDDYFSDGWYSQEFTGGTKVEIISPKTTAYRHYSITYSGVDEALENTYVKDFGYNQEVILPIPPAKNGRKFIGWKIRIGSGPGQTSLNEYVTKFSGISKNVRVSAQYETNSSSSSGGSSSGGGGGSSSGGSGGGGGGSSSSKPNKKPAVVVIVLKDTYEGSTWEQKDGIWYLKKADGTYASDWAVKDGEWYYMNPDGTMQTGWKLINNLWYYFTNSGAMAKGWTQVGGLWYYTNPTNGDMLTGWQLVDGKWYYMEPTNGNMLTGWQVIGGKHYYMTQSGDMLANTTTPDGYKVDENGVWIQ